MLDTNAGSVQSQSGTLPHRIGLDDSGQRYIRLRDYSLADLSRYARAWYLANKIDQTIDKADFHRVVARHRKEGYDSFKYFDKRMWLRAKVMRVIELGLDHRTSSSVLDLGCGPGYFLYACKYFGHDVCGVDLPDHSFYIDMMALFGVPRINARIDAYTPLPPLGRRFDVVSAHQICFNGHKTENVWGPHEWDFFIADLKANHLTPRGVIALEFNEEPLIGFYTEPVRAYFASLGARIYRGRVILQNDAEVPPARG